MPKVKATWDTPVALTPKGHAAAFYIMAKEAVCDVLCDPKTRNDETLYRAADTDLQSLTGLLQWQGIHPLDLKTISEDAA